MIGELSLRWGVVIILVFATELTAYAQTEAWPNERDPYGQNLDAGFTSQRRTDGESDELRQPSLSPSRHGRVSTQKSASADGRLSLRNYLSTDTSQTYDSPTVSLSFLEADLHLKNLTDQGLRLDLDSTFIMDYTKAAERRFGETERFDQIRNLALSQKVGSLSLSLGRRLITQAGNAWVDGLQVSYLFDRQRSEIGLYGGLSPDRFDRSLTLDYQAMGLFVSAHRTGLDLSVAYNLILYKGALDRQFIHQRTHYRILEGLYWSNYLIIDVADEPQVTTLLTTLDYTPIRALNFTVNVTQYSLEQYRNQAVYRDIIEPNQALILGNEVIDLTYQRLRFSSSWRVTEALRPYLSMELKSRAQDGRKATIYVAGLHDNDLFKTKIEADVQLQVAQNFKTDNVIFALSLRRDLSSLISVDARLTHFTGETLDQGTDRQLLFNEAQSIYMFGLSLIGRLNRSHQILFTYDGVYESEIADYKSDEPITIHTLSLLYNYLY